MHASHVPSVVMMRWSDALGSNYYNGAINSKQQQMGFKWEPVARAHVSRVSVDTCQVSPSQYIFVSTDLHPPLDVRWITMLIMLSSSDDHVIISIISDILVIQLSPPLQGHTALGTTRTRNCSPTSPGSDPTRKLWHFGIFLQNKISCQSFISR